MAATEAATEGSDSSDNPKIFHTGTTMVGILSPDHMIICADSRAYYSKTFDKGYVGTIDGDVKVFSLGESVLGAVSGKGSSGKKVLKSVVSNLGKYRSTEEVAAAFAFWSNGHQAENEFIIGGRVEKEEDLTMFMIKRVPIGQDEKVKDKTMMLEAMKKSNISVNECNGIIIEPITHVAYAHSVPVIGMGGDEARQYIRGVDPPEDDAESLRWLATRAVASACLPSGKGHYTGGPLRVVTVSKNRPGFERHTSEPGPKYDYPAIIPDGFKVRLGRVGVSPSNMRGRLKPLPRPSQFKPQRRH